MIDLRARSEDGHHVWLLHAGIARNDVKHTGVNTSASGGQTLARSRFAAGGEKCHINCLLPDRAYVVRTTHNNVMRGMRFDAPALRFTMGRSTRSLTLDAVDAVQDGADFVPIGCWYAEPVGGAV